MVKETELYPVQEVQQHGDEYIRLTCEQTNTHLVWSDMYSTYNGFSLCKILLHIFLSVFCFCTNQTASVYVCT